MGVDFICGNVTLSFTYSFWNHIRLNIFEAFIKYSESLCITNDNDEPPSIEFRHHVELAELLNRIYIAKQNITNANDDDSYLVIFEKISDINMLIYFNLSGIYTLLHKSDCEGFYSVGNSYDIYEMIQLVKPNMDSHFFKTINEEVELLFKTSWENKENIIIS